MDDLFSMPEREEAPAGDGLAVRLNAALMRGDLIGALRLVNGLPAEEVAVAMLKAGFSTQGRRDPQFWHAVQRDLTAAARARTDGWGLRGKN